MMKNLFLVAAISGAAFTANAQTVAIDTVSLGAGTANQVWYSLENDEQATAPKNEWDLAFRVSGSAMSSTILANHTGEASASSSTKGGLWIYPKADTSGWSSVDTTGLSTWNGIFNSETSWVGALGRYTNPANAFDMGWGVYKMSNHRVYGDSIYIIKTQAGNFKKLVIDSLASGVYTFTFANLDGSDETSQDIKKTDYSSKNYVYFNLDSKKVIDREPGKFDWDLTFCQYATGDYSGMGMPGYTVTGILANDTTEIVHVKVDPSVRATYNDYASSTFSRNINTIGYNWKTYKSTTDEYVYNDSSIYFVRTNNKSIWKLIFTGYISATGSMIFSKEKLETVSIFETPQSKITFAVSPNPGSTSSYVNVAYALDQHQEDVQLLVMDITGKVVAKDVLNKTSGLHNYQLNTQGFNSGNYIISIVAGNNIAQQKLIIQ